jgi:hypothetical protein
MDMSPTAPFTPLFGDQPVTVDTDLDIHLYNWSQGRLVSALDFFFSSPRIRARCHFPDSLPWSPPDIGAPRLSSDDSLPWSPPGMGPPQSFLGESMNWRPLDMEEHPLSLDDNGWRAALESDKPSNIDRNLNLCPLSQPEQISSSTHTVQVTNDGPVPIGPSDLLFDYGDRPGAADKNEIALPPSIQIPLAENSSSTSDNNNDSVTITPPSVHYQSPSDGVDLLSLAGKDHLVNLPQSVLKQLSKDVAGVLKIKKEKEQQKSRESREEKAAERLRQTKIPPKATTVFKCEYLGCNTTFRRNSERLRHVRVKHTATTKAFFCPVVDCPMGLRHKFHRIDKFREHLRGQKISSLPWACILPGCSEIAPNKVGLIEHFRQHDFLARDLLGPLLGDYGLNPHNELSYLTKQCLCTVQDCRFGAWNIFSLSNHMLVAHDGLPRPCPIPTCEAVFQDWEMTPKHLAQDHDHNTRMQFKEEIQKLHFSLSAIFSCPICHHEDEHAYDISVLNHYREHDKQQLLPASKTLFDAWYFSLGPHTTSTCRNGDLKDISLMTENKLLAYILLPNSDWYEIGSSEEDFEQAGAKLRASMVLGKDELQN